jgi:hypothetical protein
MFLLNVVHSVHALTEHFRREDAFRVLPKNILEPPLDGT